MDSTAKGNRLEDAFYEYLLEQQRCGVLVYDSIPPDHCKIFRKKTYFCKERGADVEFDIVIELYRPGRPSPHSYTVFECKNYDGAIPEIYVADFSDKLSRLFRNAAKGILVVSSRLQSGAENVARSRLLGIVKYDESGLEVVADRKGGLRLENSFVASQLFPSVQRSKSLKFSAYYDGKTYGALDQLLRAVHPELFKDHRDGIRTTSVPFVRLEELQQSALRLLDRIDYKSGAVDLSRVCALLSVRQVLFDGAVFDDDGTPILGSANFDARTIQLNMHTNDFRKRFTLAHEIGHFHLEHGGYLRSDTFIEGDLLTGLESKARFEYERLEYQANIFASELLLPDHLFRTAVEVARNRHDIRDRSHGYIYVDNQLCNIEPYDKLLSELSSYFEVSKQAVEIKLLRMGLLTDARQRILGETSAQHLGEFVTRLPTVRRRQQP